MSALQLDGLVDVGSYICVIRRLDAAFSDEIGRTALSAVLLESFV